MTTDAASNIARADPTKDFFISMLVRDIELVPAIIDLIDNSIDGARRLRANGTFDGLWIRLELNSSEFRIADNCGGIPLTVAQHYAFMFGRHKDLPPTPRSIGQFGVGMKRALFKLGRQFSVTSTTQESRFTMNVDVEAWRNDHRWTFDLDTAEDALSLGLDVTGTTITVDQLHPSVANDFDSDAFVRACLRRLFS